MYRQATSVPEAIRDVLSANHVYIQALQLGIANYTSLAERIKPDIEKLIGSTVNLNTIVVGIKRIADTLEEKKIEKSRPIASKAKMSLTGSIMDIDFHNWGDGDDTLEKILDKFFEQDSPYNLFQSDDHITLLTEDVDEIRKLVAGAVKKLDGRISEGLSKIDISLAEDEENPYHLLSLVSNVLYSHNIPIHSTFFTSGGLVLILTEKDAARAYDLIRKQIS
jgi:hypothetical protein